jgi:hypothetical protein
VQFFREIRSEALPRLLNSGRSTQTLHGDQTQTVEAANRDNTSRHPDTNISMPKSHFGVERQSTHATTPLPRDKNKTSA